MANATQVHTDSVEAREPRPPSRPVRLPGVDGLRALAVTAVLIYHVNPRLLPGGYLGVDVFFVVSGYLITRLLLAERGNLRHFWVRRARRILPPLVPVLLVTVLAVAWASRAQLRSLRTEVLGALTFTSNWVQIAEHHSYFARFAAPSVLQHLWSLAVEEQFYLLWPLVVVLVLRRGRNRLALLAALGAVASMVVMSARFTTGGDPSRVYFGTDTHCAGLLIGAVLAVLWSGAAGTSRLRTVGRNVAAVVGIGVVGVGLWRLSEYGPGAYRGGIAVVSAATALLILGAGAGRSGVGWLLSRAPVRWLGARSYGLYLWHWPILVIGSQLAKRTVPVALVEVGVALTLTVWSYRYLEQPVLRAGYQGLLRRGWLVPLDRRRTTRRAALLAGGAAAVACVVAATVALVRAPVAPPSGLDAQLAAASVATGAPPAPTPAPSSAAPSPTPSTSAAPPIPPVPRGTDISALGDSVMLAAAPALQRRLPGISIDAKVSRAMQPAPGILSGMAGRGTLRPVVLLGLGTNGPFPRSLLEGVVRRLGPHRRLFLVNVYLPTRPWGGQVNRTLEQVAAEFDNVYLVDWRDAAAKHENLLWPDRIHPRPGGGANLYARTVAAALAGPDDDEELVPANHAR
ncbi:acyltransferase family protein [Actinocatenispora rupis]|uniref:Acyltransferase 3 domain-containing protein n=1 Tax=Actinocatenispora rupis TaxID=519421 RepID=A0A8J3N7X5_9ACTN|nr:acyltransferase family protein [Actinocatenispora rupis]GID09724.1 hypothetical protein Aru02nite_06130 [Actinocatenispora rupis]